MHHVESEVEYILQRRSELPCRIDLEDVLSSRIYGISLFCHPCLEDFHSSLTCASSIDASVCVEKKSFSLTCSGFLVVMVIVCDDESDVNDTISSIE